jgi:hypothetical protein
LEVSAELTIRLGRGSASAGEIQACIDELLAELESGSAIAPDGVDGAAQPGIAKVSVTEDSSGLDPLTSAIIVAIVTELTVAGAKALWSKYLLPGIKRRIGADAVNDDEA